MDRVGTEFAKKEQRQTRGWAAGPTDRAHSPVFRHFAVMTNQGHVELLGEGQTAFLIGVGGRPGECRCEVVMR